MYDPLGLASPVLLEGKLLYRETSVQKSAWDSPLPEDLAAQWKKWEENIPDAVTVERCVPRYEEEIHQIQLHAFVDASGRGVCAAVYAVVTQASGTKTRIYYRKGPTYQTRAVHSPTGARIRAYGSQSGQQRATSSGGTPTSS